MRGDEQLIVWLWTTRAVPCQIANVARFSVTELFFIYNDINIPVLHGLPGKPQ
jgi:hypothetical protein